MKKGFAIVLTVIAVSGLVFASSAQNNRNEANSGSLGRSKRSVFYGGYGLGYRGYGLDYEYGGYGGYAYGYP
ncbi:hypothetical protein BIW11_13910, partial [Tropilaelaps mercedesae]